MLLTLHDLANCKQCQSRNTKVEILIPSLNPKKLRGKEKNSQIVEISCKNCGKIDRREIKLAIE